MQDVQERLAQGPTGTCPMEPIDVGALGTGEAEARPAVGERTGEGAEGLEAQEEPEAREAAAAQDAPAAGSAEPPYLSARGLELKTYAGYAFRGVDIDAFKGQVTAVRGRNGSGKTALLLTLAGRMKPTGGTLSVGGLELPRQRAKAERHVGLGLFKGLNDLPENLTVASAAKAEFDLRGRAPRREAVEEYLRWWGFDDVARVRLRDLTAEKLARLGIALAFVGDPDAVAVDDVEDQLTLSQSRGLMELLACAARERHAAVAVGVVERDLAAMADACVYLAKEGE